MYSNSCYCSSCIISMKLFHMTFKMFLLNEFCSTDIAFMFSLLTMGMDLITFIKVGPMWHSEFVGHAVRVRKRVRGFKFIHVRVLRHRNEFAVRARRTLRTLAMSFDKTYSNGLQRFVAFWTFLGKVDIQKFFHGWSFDVFLILFQWEKFFHIFHMEIDLPSPDHALIRDSWTAWSVYYRLGGIIHTVWVVMYE